MQANRYSLDAVGPRTAQTFWAVLFAACALLLPAAAQDARTARAEFSNAYTLYRQGEQAEGRGQAPVALEHYRQALDAFSAVRTTYPNFETTLVNYRIGWLKEKIKSLSSTVVTQTTGDIATIADTDMAQLIARQTQRLQDMETANAEMRTQVKQLRDALDTARREAANNADAAKKRDELLVENHELRQTVQAVNKQVTDITAQLEQRRGSTSDADYLAWRQERATLTARIDQAEAERDVAIKDSARKTEQLNRLSIDRAVGDLTTDQADDRVNRAAATIRQLDDRLKLADATIDRLKRESAEQNKNLVQSMTEIADLRALVAGTEGGAQIVRAQSELLEIKKQLNNSEGERERLARARDQAQAQLDQLQKSNQKLRLDVARYEAQLATGSRDVEVTVSVATEVQRQRDEAVGQLTELRQKYNALVDLQRELAGELEDLKTKHQAQLKWNELLLARLQDGGKMASAGAAESVSTPATTSTSDPADADDRLKKARAEIAVLSRQVQTLIRQLDLANTQLDDLKKNGIANDTRSPYLRLPEQVQQLLRSAIQAEHDGNAQTAANYYQQVLAVIPDEVTALKRLGAITYAAGDPAKAEEYLAHAFYIAPDDRDVLVPLGTLYFQREQPMLAFSILSRAVAIYPDDPMVQRNFGVASMQAGWHEMAERSLLLANKLDPRSPDTAMYLAILYASRKPPAMKMARQWYSTAKDLGASADPGLEQLLQPEP